MVCIRQTCVDKRSPSSVHRALPPLWLGFRGAQAASAYSARPYLSCILSHYSLRHILILNTRARPLLCTLCLNRSEVGYYERKFFRTPPFDLLAEGYYNVVSIRHAAGRLGIVMYARHPACIYSPNPTCCINPHTNHRPRHHVFIHTRQVFFNLLAISGSGFSTAPPYVAPGSFPPCPGR